MNLHFLIHTQPGTCKADIVALQSLSFSLSDKLSIQRIHTVHITMKIIEHQADTDRTK